MKMFTVAVLVAFLFKFAACEDDQTMALVNTLVNPRAFNIFSPQEDEVDQFPYFFYLFFYLGILLF